MRAVVMIGRRPAVWALVVLVAAGLVLLLAPLDLAAIRLGPLSLLWWYCVIAAPAAGAVVAWAALAGRPVP